MGNCDLAMGFNLPLLNRRAILCLQTLVVVVALHSLWVSHAKRISHGCDVKYLKFIFFFTRIAENKLLKVQIQCRKYD